MIARLRRWYHRRLDQKARRGEVFMSGSWSYVPPRCTREGWLR